MCNSSEDKEASESGTGSDSRAKRKRLGRFERDIQGLTTKTRLDRNLLRGLLQNEVSSEN